MRLHRLALEGFGPFRDRQTVDFDAFADDGIFLISGRTGAGKSSILDGVCFALYGDVPRYSGSDKRLRSDHCAPDDPTEVELEFSLGDRRLRVTRSPEYSRPKRRGEGLTPVKQQAQLDEWADGTWVGLASGPRDVGLLLGDVLGLTREQFLQVILLAQGRFAQFLLAGNDERQAVLRTLFGTRRFEDYARALVERRKRAADDVEQAKVSLELLLAHGEHLSDDPVSSPEAEAAEARPIPDRIDALEAATDLARSRVESSEAAVEQAQKRRLLAETDLAEGKRIAQGQKDLLAERATLATLEAEGPAMTALQDESAKAQAAETLRATLEAHDRRSAELQQARRDEALARAALSATGSPLADGTDVQLEAAIEGWVAQLAAWQDVEKLERQQPEARDRLQQLNVRLDEVRRGLGEADVEMKSAPARSAALDPKIAEAATAAGAETGIRKDIDADAARLAAARELVTAEQRLTEAAAGELAASARAQEAGNAVVRLLQQRLDNHAGELAAELRPGEPCMVCGSHDHPEPAVSGAEAITDETIDRAVAERDSLRLLEADAAQNARDAQQRRNELAERSGGATVAQVEARLEELRAQAAVAAEARERGEALTRERAQIDEQAKAAAARVDLLNAQVMQLTAEIATADHDLRSAQKRIDDARGDTSSVQARIAETRTLRTAAAALVAALRTLTVTQAAAADARTDLDARIAQSPFADPEAASAALRDDESREHMTLKVAEYGQKVSTSRARLFDLELQMLPDEPVDLAFLQRRHTDADLDYQDAVDRRSRAEGTARTLAEVLAKVRAQYDAVGPLVSQAEQIATLADAVSGRGANTHRMTLEAFVLAAELEEIVAQANVRLDEMSSGRYRLQHTDARAARNAASGLGIEVMDAFTGVARPATSLSGGETFLASLALALGLADVVTARAGGIRLDTLFVDEGFGSLDSETLDVAMDTLESLRHGGRTVGVISHVEAMREQLPTQLRVTAGAHGPSRIEQQAPLGVV